ncbi:MAG TPA: diguanylate cyclase [Treponemataceae bacterium]|nr:diguanylate cyclase [Treponemataceae bacterium]HPS45205.1 diguanylate cyclase [Treponemataceae bacterium]
MVFILAIALFAISSFMAVFAFLSISRGRMTAAGIPLSLLLIALAIYSGGYAGELLSATLKAKLIWNAIQYLGISFLPALWILFTARYVNVQRLYRRSAIALLAAISLTTLFGALTDGFLHLRYSSVWIDSTRPLGVLAFTRGPLYWSHTAFSFVALTIGTTLLLNGLVTTPRYFRRQLLLMLAGTALPWVNYVLYLAGLNFHGVDTIPFSMFLSVVCFGTAIFRYRILDVIPVARSRVFETMADGVIVLDTYGRIADFNRSAARVLPELVRDVISQDAVKTLAGREALCMNIEMNVEADFSFTLGSGEAARNYVAKISFIRNHNGEQIGRIAMFQDNTETSRLLARLKELATLDSLTGISNRRNFMDQASRQIALLARGGKPMAFVLLDLDNFKRLNDTHGHLVGDEALRRVAKELVSQVRPGDVVARFGGEEFICILSEATPDAAPLVAERMRAAIEGISIPLEDGSSARVTASLGVQCVDAVTGTESIDALLARADTALYAAKEGGRNRVAVCREPSV